MSFLAWIVLGLIAGFVDNEPTHFSCIDILKLDEDVVGIGLTVADRLATGKAGQHGLEIHRVKCSSWQKKERQPDVSTPPD